MFAVFNYIRALAVCVVRLEFVCRYGYGHRLRRAGFKLFGLVEADEFNRSLFYVILLVVFGVGLLNVCLNDFLALHVARVGYGYADFIVAVAVLFNSVVAVRERGIRTAVAEGEGNFVGIRPALACVARSNARRAVCVAAAQNEVFIPRLVVAVAHVYALCIYDVFGVVGVLRIRRHAVVLGEGIVAEVYRGGSGIGVHRPRIGQPAVRVGAARKQLCKLVVRSVAAHTYPHTGVYIVFEDVFHRHCRGGVD